MARKSSKRERGLNKNRKCTWPGYWNSERNGIRTWSEIFHLRKRELRTRSRVSRLGNRRNRTQHVFRLRETETGIFHCVTYTLFFPLIRKYGKGSAIPPYQKYSSKRTTSNLTVAWISGTTNRVPPLRA